MKPNIHIIRISPHHTTEDTFDYDRNKNIIVLYIRNDDDPPQALVNTAMKYARSVKRLGR